MGAYQKGITDLNVTSNPVSLEINHYPFAGWSNWLGRRVDENLAAEADRNSPTQARIAAFRCPSDGTAVLNGTQTVTNYRGSMGDIVANIGGNQRASSPRSWLRIGSHRISNNTSNLNDRPQSGEIGIEAITDGTSNTLLITEGVVWDGTPIQTWEANFKANLLEATTYYNQNPNNCLRLKGSGGRAISQAQAQAAGWGNSGRTSGANEDTRPGARACDNQSPIGTGIFTLLPPNSPSCGSGTYMTTSASSYHAGGVAGCLADASVRFITDSIHTANLTRSIPQNVNGDGTNDFARIPTHPRDANGSFDYGTWGNLGAINSGASVSF